MAPLKSWFSAVIKPVKNCFNTIKVCIREWSEIYLGWFFLQFIPALLVVFKFPKLTPLKAWCSGIVIPVKNCFNAVKFCITEWLEIFVGWLFLGFIPGLQAVFKSLKLVGIKGLIFVVALPLLDVSTDSKFVYDMYQSYKSVEIVELQRKIIWESIESHNSTSLNDKWSCTNHFTNRSRKPYNVLRGVMPACNYTCNVTCIELSSGRMYIPATKEDKDRRLWFYYSGINTLFKMVRYVFL